MKLFLLLVFAGLAAAGCRPAAKSTAAAPAERTPEQALHERLNPIHQTTAMPIAPPSAPSAPEPLTIFPVPIRSWLPPAVMADQPRALPANPNAAGLPSLPSSEIPPLAPLAAPERPPLPTTPLAKVPGPDASHYTTWIVSNPAPGAPPRALDFDAPPDAPPEGVSSPAKGLRETSAPFLRLTIPDPFEQLATAELRNPPADSDVPVFFVPRPALSLPESTIVAAGK